MTRDIGDRLDNAASAWRVLEKQCRPPFHRQLPESIALAPAANSSQDQQVGSPLQLIERVKFSALDSAPKVRKIRFKCSATFGERYRQGETISTAFVESTINQVVSRRFVKKQQMSWTLRGAHLLLQTRTKVLNNELEKVFRAVVSAVPPQSGLIPTLCCTPCS